MFGSHFLLYFSGIILIPPSIPLHSIRGVSHRKSEDGLCMKNSVEDCACDIFTLAFQVRLCILFIKNIGEKVGVC
jgi:hypothetical protein